MRSGAIATPSTNSWIGTAPNRGFHSARQWSFGIGCCRAAGGELEQIQFLLGHVSVQTTERYLGCTQRIAAAVNDKIGIEPAS
jgi:hypothetical protein